MRMADLSSVYCRCTRDVYAPLDATGATRLGGRFNPKGLPALYLAEDPELAIKESTRTRSWAGFEPFAPRRLVCVRLQLQRVVNLTDEQTLQDSGLSADSVTAPRARSAEPTSTQLFGERAFLEGAEAIVYPSAFDRSRTNIVVFTDNLREGSTVDIVPEDSRTD